MTEIEIHWLLLALSAAGLASVHLWFPWFDVRFSHQQSRWMGFIGGVATCYVILYLLPKIARITTKMIGLDPDTEMAYTHLRMYFILLTAIVIYLIMVHLDAPESRWRILARMFDYAVHGAYSFLVGYVFIEMSSDLLYVTLLIALILGLHLIGMSHILRSMRASDYDARARWVYCLLILLGAGLGLVTELPQMVMNSVTAFLAGIILINVISEEIPLKYTERVPWYLSGIAFYLLASYLIIGIDPRSAY